MKGMEAIPGEHIREFASRMLITAEVFQTTVVGLHNDFPLWAIPGMVRDDVLAPWNEMMWRTR